MNLAEITWPKSLFAAGKSHRPDSNLYASKVVKAGSINRREGTAYMRIFSARSSAWEGNLKIVDICTC